MNVCPRMVYLLLVLLFFGLIVTFQDFLIVAFVRYITRLGVILRQKLHLK